MTTTKKKRSARDKRIMVAAVIVAGAIVAGSTFAWFTSKDEVTNRLSASADYDVAIAEDFQPPENWVPGQEINKDVSAVNTGNVDAFVRMWLEGEMSVFNRTSFADAQSVPNNNSTGAGYMNASADEKTKLGFSFYTASGNYIRELSTKQRENPNQNSTTPPDEDTNNPAKFSEVQSVQSGGYLVYAPDNAGYSWTLEQATTMSVNGTTVTDLAKGTVVGTGNSTASGATKISAADTNYYGAIDASTFKPETEGLYIFRRNVKLDVNGNKIDTYEYSGYYFVPSANSTNLGLTTPRDVYLALYNSTENNSDYSLADGSVTPATTTPSGEVTSVTPVWSKIKFDTAKETIVKNSGLTWTYTADTKLTATYAGTDASSAADDIAIDVKLANIGTGGQTWTAKTEVGKTTTFYYNDDLEEGDTTAKLVDSVTLSSATTQHAFLAFDFDLNVFLESVQVTMGDDGKEMTTPVEDGGAFATAPAGGVGAYATAQNVSEIENITWI